MILANSAATSRSTAKLWAPPRCTSYTLATLGLRQSMSSGAHEGI